MSMIAEVMKFPGRTFGESDLRQFLAELDEHLQRAGQGDERHGGVLRTSMAMAAVRHNVQNDRDAELARCGLRLGLAIAALDRQVYARDVQRSRQRRGQETKAQKRAKSDAKMARQYEQLLPDHGDLEARRKLQKKHKLRSLESVGKAIGRASTRV